MNDPRADREGVYLRRRWFGREFLPFDEIDSVESGVARLVSGRTRALPAHLLPGAERALSPPAPNGDRVSDADALHHYVSGDWSPRRAARALVILATAAHASDIHLEAHADRYTIRLRIAGEMVDFTSFTPSVGARLVAALKHLARCLPYRSDRVQEGRIPRRGIAADARVSFLPTALGERVAVRLFGELLPLDRLGFPEAHRVRFEQALDTPAGLVLVAGPSGGGKTTTLYAALAHLAARRSDAHLSLEDPVEQRLRLAGIPVDQVELCPERGLTAEAALVGALRQDVDVLGVGEIRTAAEAALALRAAHTGRLVLAGLHAGSAPEAGQRMLDLGVERGVLEATLLLVLHQRLRTVPCPRCRGTGCEDCHHVGRLRQPVVELATSGEVL